MAHSSWGGPGLNRNQLARITNVAGIPLYVRREVAPLFQALVNDLHGARKPGAPGLSSSGGYNYRKISGSSSWSNHSWGLAADLNAATNPYRYGPLTTDFVPEKAREAARRYGMRWGGDYSSKKDAMHFEFMGSMAEAKERVAKLGKGAPLAGVYEPGSEGPEVVGLEIRLYYLGFGGNGMKLDGVYDAATRANVLAYQKDSFTDPKHHDGIAGPVTLKDIETRPLGLKAVPDTKPRNTLYPGESLLPGQRLTSANGEYILILQPDGNLVVYQGGTARWATHVRGNRLIMQDDGNCVLYLDSPDGKLAFPVWWTSTVEKGSRLVMQDDGNAVVYHDVTSPTWRIK